MSTRRVVWSGERRERERERRAKGEEEDRDRGGGGAAAEVGRASQHRPFGDSVSQRPKGIGSLQVHVNHNDDMAALENRSDTCELLYRE